MRAISVICVRRKGLGRFWLRMGIVLKVVCTCNFFTGIITRFGEIYDLGAATVKHEDVVEAFKLTDKNDYFARWEIIPLEKAGYSKPVNMDNWVFKLDEKEVPNWWEEEFESKCWRHFKNWMASKAGEEFKKSLEGKTPEELIAIYTKGKLTLKGLEQ